MENKEMIEAVKNGELDKIQKGIDEGFDLNEIVDGEHTIVMYSRNIPTMVLLVENGADLAFKKKNGEYQLNFENALWDTRADSIGSGGVDLQGIILKEQPHMYPIFKKYGVNLEGAKGTMAANMGNIDLL